LFHKVKFEYKVFHKGLYIVGQNTKKPNTIKRSDKGQTKNITKITKWFHILWSEANWDLFEGLRHD